MMFARPRLILLLSLLLLSFGVAGEDDPAALVRSTASHVLAQVEMHRAELKKDSSGIYKLVEADVIPHFDFHKMSRAALGKHWRQATVEQKDRLAHEFRELLVRSYAIALLGYSGDDVQYLPIRSGNDPHRVLVPTKVTTGGAPPVPIDYRLYKAANGWMVYDVVIDGISLVSNYRSSFATEIRRGGIDGLIQTLASRNEKLRG